MDPDSEEEGQIEAPFHQAWFGGAEQLVMAYWHDPRTAVKYVLGILRLLQGLQDLNDLTTINPHDVPPVRQEDIGFV